MRSLHADTTNIADATYDGQPAWLLSSDALLITVDKVASFPVSVEVRDGGKTTMRLSIHDLAVNPPTSSADFVAKIPTDATVSSEDSRYIETDIDKAPALAGYAVPQPKVVPDGYTVHSAWFNASAVSGAETFTNQVRVTYRKGLSSFVVEIARLGATKQRDPWMGDTTPHRFVSADGLVAVVGGDLTAAELVDVANSLSL